MELKLRVRQSDPTFLDTIASAFPRLQHLEISDLYGWLGKEIFSFDPLLDEERCLSTDALPSADAGQEERSRRYPGMTPSHLAHLFSPLRLLSSLRHFSYLFDCVTTRNDLVISDLAQILAWRNDATPHLASVQIHDLYVVIPAPTGRGWVRMPVTQLHWFHAVETRIKRQIHGELSSASTPPVLTTLTFKPLMTVCRCLPILKTKLSHSFWLQNTVCWFTAASAR